MGFRLLKLTGATCMKIFLRVYRSTIFIAVSLPVARYKELDTIFHSKVSKIKLEFAKRSRLDFGPTVQGKMLVKIQHNDTLGALPVNSWPRTSYGDLREII